jgi:hypothetical protein
LAAITTPHLSTNFIQIVGHAGATALFLKTLADNLDLARYIEYIEDSKINPHKSMRNRLLKRTNMEKLRHAVDSAKWADQGVELQFGCHGSFP